VALGAAKSKIMRELPVEHAPLICRHCGDVIGSYEPVVVVRDDGCSRETSRVAEPDLPSLTPEIYHRACYAEPRAYAEPGHVVGEAL
jgi:hypothetical protein